MSVEAIRGQEVTVQVVVDGDVRGGSFARVTDFDWTPQQELPEIDFLGETESDIDFQHSGHAFSFSLHQQDRKVHALLLDQITREQARRAQPVINLVVTYAYRVGVDTPQTIVFETCKLKLDSSSVGGRKDYVLAKVSGKCRTVSAM